MTERGQKGLRHSGRDMHQAVITLDVHGLHTAAARAAVLAALRRSRGAYRLRVVHGYHGGTALGDMVRAEFASDARVLRVHPVDAGVTDLVLREL